MIHRESNKTGRSLKVTVPAFFRFGHSDLDANQVMFLQAYLLKGFPYKKIFCFWGSELGHQLGEAVHFVIDTVHSECVPIGGHIHADDGFSEPSLCLVGEPGHR